jgi:hypothetical protein
MFFARAGKQQIRFVDLTKSWKSTTGEDLSAKGCPPYHVWLVAMDDYYDFLKTSLFENGLGSFKSRRAVGS